jgi:hypothetical protein
VRPSALATSKPAGGRARPLPARSQGTTDLARCQSLLPTSGGQPVRPARDIATDRLGRPECDCHCHHEGFEGRMGPMASRGPMMPPLTTMQTSSTSRFLTSDRGREPEDDDTLSDHTANMRLTVGGPLCSTDLIQLTTFIGRVDMIEKRGRMLGVIALIVALFGMLPAATAPTAADEPDGSRGAIEADDPERPPGDWEPGDAIDPSALAPDCVFRWYEEHWYAKHVHGRNDCRGVQYVKVIVAHGPDSGCITALPDADADDFTHSWMYGWPYWKSNFDRLERC